MLTFQLRVERHATFPKNISALWMYSILHITISVYLALERHEQGFILFEKKSYQSL